MPCSSHSLIEKQPEIHTVEKCYFLNSQFTLKCNSLIHMEWQTVQTRSDCSFWSSLIWVCAVCFQLSVSILRTFMALSGFCLSNAQFLRDLLFLRKNESICDIYVCQMEHFLHLVGLNNQTAICSLSMTGQPSFILYVLTI